MSRKPDSPLRPTWGSDPRGLWIAAKEILHLAPGDSVELDADDLAFPEPFSKAPAGEYRVRAVLDTNHTYAYVQDDDGDNPPFGAREFANSVNNGPWSDALVNELIPALERKYRMDARRSGRLLQGHSSGGWAALWLQVTYPSVFGGAWPTAPDPADFRAFIPLDLTTARNIYRKPDGSRRIVMRVKGKEIAMEVYARREFVLGEYGGQISSFEAVFSPRAADGRPMQLFDRVTGEIDREVARAWERYDIARASCDKIGANSDRSSREKSTFTSARPTITSSTNPHAFWSRRSKSWAARQRLCSFPAAHTRMYTRTA